MEKTVNNGSQKRTSQKKNYVNPVVAWGLIIAELCIIGAIMLIVTM